MGLHFTGSYIKEDIRLCHNTNFAFDMKTFVN